MLSAEYEKLMIQGDSIVSVVDIMASFCIDEVDSSEVFITDEAVTFEFPLGTFSFSDPEDDVVR